MPVCPQLQLTGYLAPHMWSYMSSQGVAGSFQLSEQWGLPQSPLLFVFQWTCDSKEQRCQVAWVATVPYETEWIDFLASSAKATLCCLTIFATGLSEYCNSQSGCCVIASQVALKEPLGDLDAARVNVWWECGPSLWSCLARLFLSYFFQKNLNWILYAS